MKQTLITIVIAVITGISGYLLGVNKSSLEDSFTSIKQEETNRKFSSETVFQINPYGTMSDALGRNIMMTRQFFQTQFAIIESEETISKAIDDYDLENLLGKNKQELAKDIAESIKLGQERGTDLIKLTVRADSELKAQQVAYAVTHAYARRRIEGLEKRRKESIEQFAEKRKEQEDRVEEHRARLYALSKRLQIPYHGKDGSHHLLHNSNASESDTADQVYEEAKRTKDQLESFINSFNGLNDEDLLVTLIASGRPDSAVLKTDYDLLSGFKQSRAVALASGLGVDHKTIISLNVSMKSVEDRLARSLVSIRKKLAEDFVVLNQNVEKLRLETSREVCELMVGAEEKTLFGKVREDYERELAILDAIKQAEFTESIGQNLERDPILFHQFGWTPEVAAAMKLSE